MNHKGAQWQGMNGIVSLDNFLSRTKKEISKILSPWSLKGPWAQAHSVLNSPTEGTWTSEKENHLTLDKLLSSSDPQCPWKRWVVTAISILQTSFVTNIRNSLKPISAQPGRIYLEPAGVSPITYEEKEGGAESHQKTRKEDFSCPFLLLMSLFFLPHPPGSASELLMEGVGTGGYCINKRVCEGHYFKILVWGLSILVTQVFFKTVSHVDWSATGPFCFLSWWLQNPASRA